MAGAIITNKALQIGIPFLFETPVAATGAAQNVPILTNTTGSRLAVVSATVRAAAAANAGCNCKLQRVPSGVAVAGVGSADVAPNLDLNTITANTNASFTVNVPDAADASPTGTLGAEDYAAATNVIEPGETLFAVIAAASTGLAGALITVYAVSVPSGTIVNV
jgi:hypothetical protein